MESFCASNQFPGYLRQNPRNTLGESIEIGGVDTNSSHSIGLDYSNIAHTNSNVAHFVQEQQQPAQNISAEHRRKRRRMTVEDAFQNLSLRQQQQNGAVTTYGNTRDAIEDMHRVHRVIERSSMSDISDNTNQSQTPIFSGSEKITTTVTPMTISKKLFSDTTNSAVDLHKGGSDDVAYSLRSNLSCIPDDFKDRSGRSRNEPTKFDFQMEGDDDKSCSSVSSSICSNGTPEKNSSSPSLHLNDTLFAPRKPKIRSGFGASVTGTTTSTDPVDARIEELIRHTRIRAMVKASIRMDKENNGKNSSSSRKCTNGLLLPVKKKEDEGQQMDSGGELRRKNNADNMDCGWEGAENFVMVTKDDIDLNPRVEYDSLDSMHLDGDNMKSSIIADGHRSTKIATHYVRGAQKRGRTKWTKNNDTRSGNGTSNSGFVAWQPRSKSLPKQT